MTTVDLDLDHERRRLFGLAYRMIGEVAEAEDAVQDALARWAAADREAVRNADKLAHVAANVERSDDARPPGTP